MLERNPEFMAINKKLIKISFIRQMKDKYFTLDKLELFVVIKYINFKDLIELINEFENFKLKIEIKTLNWLIIKVFPNIVKLYNENKNLYSLFSDELKNILYICSFNNLTIKQASVMLREIKILINSRKIDLNIYEIINKFIDSQKNINQKDLIDILEIMINKIICSNGSIPDSQALEGNYLWSPFKHINNKGIVYDNINLIKNFVQALEKYNIKQKIQFSKGFLINIYNISNEEIKKMIKDFMLNINPEEMSQSNLKDIDINNTQDFNIDALDNYGLKVSFKLFLAIQKFIEIDNNFIEEIKQYPEEDKDNLNYLGKVTGKVKYLVEEMKIEDFKELLQELLKLIDEVNEKRNNKNLPTNI
jgi:hypothetical protein